MGFFKVKKELDQNNYLFISGYLGKFEPEKTQEVADRKQLDFNTLDIQDSVVAKSKFYLHIKSRIIAFQIVGQDISISSFRNRFCSVFNAGYDDLLVDTDIQLIEETNTLIASLAKFEKVFSFNVNLHPSNPNHRDIWKDVDKRLQKLRAKKYKEEIGADWDSEGLDIANDGDVKSKIYMAADGYGKATVKGEMEGELRTISTGKNPIVQEIADSVSKEDCLLHRLSLMFGKIFERMKNHKDR
ncbi:MAG: hypothetical protein MK008_07985 [Bdellovibrionales bacterium]|nr:hypothetical protein [Bdellovibrionales bacterium]